MQRKPQPATTLLGSLPRADKHPALVAPGGDAVTFAELQRWSTASRVSSPEPACGRVTLSRSRSRTALRRSSRSLRWSRSARARRRSTRATPRPSSALTSASCSPRRCSSGATRRPSRSRSARPRGYASSSSRMAPPEPFRSVSRRRGARTIGRRDRAPAPHQRDDRPAEARAAAATQPCLLDAHDRLLVSVVRPGHSLCVMPLFHVHGLVASALSALHAGGTVVAPRRFSASAFWSDAVRTVPPGTQPSRRSTTCSSRPASTSRFRRTSSASCDRAPLPCRRPCRRRSRSASPCPCCRPTA